MQHLHNNNDPDYINPEIAKAMWDKVMPEIGVISGKTVIISSTGGAISGHIDLLRQ